MIIWVLDTLCVRDSWMLLLKLFHLGYRHFFPGNGAKMLVDIINVID
jgi:hypothetical protein